MLRNAVQLAFFRVLKEKSLGNAYFDDKKVSYLLMPTLYLSIAPTSFLFLQVIERLSFKCMLYRRVFSTSLCTELTLFRSEIKTIQN